MSRVERIDLDHGNAVPEIIFPDGMTWRKGTGELDEPGGTERGEVAEGLDLVGRVTVGHSDNESEGEAFGRFLESTDLRRKAVVIESGEGDSQEGSASRTESGGDQAGAEGPVFDQLVNPVAGSFANAGLTIKGARDRPAGEAEMAGQFFGGAKRRGILAGPVNSI
jgi:hypothetical protein